MSHLESMMSFYRSELSAKMKKLSMPLDTTFGLDVFWYHVNGADGSYSFAGNCPEITEFYYGNNLHHHNPYLRHPDNYRTGAVLPFCTSDPEYLRTQLATHDRFGMGQTLLIMLKEDSVCHHFGFASTKNNVPMDRMYLENLSLIQKFQEHFLKEWRIYRSKMETHTFNLAEIIGSKYFEVSDPNKSLVTEAQKQVFLTQLRSAEELDCTSDSLHVYKKAVDAIESNLFSPLEIKHLAKVVGASPTTLMRHFKMRANETVYSYIKRRRLDEAMELLKSGSHSIAEVASLVGYENFGSFSEAFKSQFHRPPSFFKK